MDLFSEKAKLVAKQVRYSWSFLIFVLIFVLTLWTFQLVLIVRFQTFWPSGGTLCFSDQDDFLETKRILQRNSLQEYDSSNYLNSPYKIVCYYVVGDNSSNNGNTLNINPFLCSHINVGFAMVLNGGVIPRKKEDLMMYKYINNLKSINPLLKIMLSVQEYSSPSGELAKVVSTDKGRKNFSEIAVKFITQHGFDGLDIDWEFPSWPTPNPAQKRNFTLLIKELRSSINSFNPNLTMSIAVGAPASIFLQCYEIADMAKYVDWVNLMSYDYHLYGKLTPTTGPNAPLYQRPQDSTLFATLNTNWSAAHWLFWGMPSEKIIIGIPTYGHSFSLLNPDNNGWYAPAVGIGATGEAGFTTYPDACKFLNKVGSTLVWDEHYEVPYSYLGSEWISFESLDSVKHKAELVKKTGYGGAMIFSLNTDDGSGVCLQGSYPLTSLVHSVLYHQSLSRGRIQQEAD